MPTISNREHELFTEWAALSSPFIRDGVVEPGSYAGSTPRIVFLLKEVNAPQLAEGDLRPYLASGARWQTWNNVARWTQVIRASYPAPHTRPNTGSYRHCTPATRAEVLRSIAVVNVKKSPGGPQANHRALEAAVSTHGAFIARQLAIYDWEWIVAGGLPPGAVIDRIPGLAGVPWEFTGNKVPFKRFGPTRILISLPHPAARIGVTVNMERLSDAIFEILQAPAAPLRGADPGPQQGR